MPTPATSLTACRHCGASLPIPNTRHRTFCNAVCRRALVAARYRERNLRYGIQRSTSTVGAISELTVSTDLLRRGFDVFRALSPAGPCDLVVLRGDRLLRIEVRTGSRAASGRITWGKRATDRADHYAVVLHTATGDEIHYFPPIG